MKNFNTKSHLKKLDGVKVDGKDIYLNLSSGNIIDFSKLAKHLDEDDPEMVDKMAFILFSEESYQLVRMLDLADFVSVVDLAIPIIEAQANIIMPDKFKVID